MNIAVLGTGPVGQTISAKLNELGNGVMIGTRDPARTQANREGSPMGTPPFSEWHKSYQKVKLGTFAEAAKFGQVAFLCTNGSGTLEALKLAGAESLNGKTVIDISNPLDFSKGMPPSLLPQWSNTNSLGEEVQKALPGAHVVKSLNIVNCEVMVNAKKTGGDPTMFVAGNDAGAKDQVKGILKQFGWTDIIDLGDITGARGMEMLLPIWVRIWGATRNGYFGFKIVK
ncbi:MAG TPA: NAD(P)-binding domain-containing protein [Bacteroidota bacterium]